MCGRFTQAKSSQVIAQAFELENIPPLNPRYNIAPTQSVGTILLDEKGRQFKMLRWGLIPSWAKDAKIGAKLINARAETVAEKPAFRAAFKKRRCLIIADGFYEWQQVEGKKQPFYFQLKAGQPFAFAGLWESWNNKDGECLKSCTILTTEANPLMQPIHNRMPVMLSPQDYDIWLNPEIQKLEVLQPLLSPYPETEMLFYPVSPLVNKPIHDAENCIQPLNSI